MGGGSGTGPGPKFSADGFNETEIFTTNHTTLSARATEGPPGPMGPMGSMGAEGPPGRDCEFTREEFDDLKARVEVLEELLGERERERIERTGEYFPGSAT